MQDTEAWRAAGLFAHNRETPLGLFLAAISAAEKRTPACARAHSRTHSRTHSRAHTSLSPIQSRLQLVNSDIKVILRVLLGGHGITGSAMRFNKLKQKEVEIKATSTLKELSVESRDSQGHKCLRSLIQIKVNCPNIEQACMRIEHHVGDAYICHYTTSHPPFPPPPSLHTGKTVFHIEYLMANLFLFLIFYICITTATPKCEF